MKETPYQILMAEEEESFNLKGLFLKYLRYWHWFLAGVIGCILVGFLVMRYAPIVYDSTAKIKILEEDEALSVDLDPSSILSGKSNITLENEIQVLKSYRLLEQVVEDLSLDVDYFEVGRVKTRQEWNLPFIVQKNITEDSIGSPREYLVELGGEGFQIIDAEDRRLQIEYGKPDSLQNVLPFLIRVSPNASEINSDDKTYKVVIKNKRETVLQLSKDIEVQPTDKESDILALSLSGESIGRSEAILNTIIDKFNQDGILDRQQVSQRTLDFIDDRFVYLTQELDSIEAGKQSFMQRSDLANIEADAGVTLERRSEVETRITDLETQIYLAKNLKETVEGQSAFGMLPGDIGLANLNLNTMVAGYNELVLEREKVLPNMGEKNPLLQELNAQLQRRRLNILKSLNIYETQLRTSLSRLRQEGAQTQDVYAQLPEKARMLRAIERQQNLKENLFLVLLEKREEAAINLAVTAPSIKVIDYALTSRIPASPKPMQVYGIALLAGLLLPFGLLYLKFSLDTQIHSRADLEKALPDIPIVAEIPFIPQGKGKKERDERSQLSESFRILSTNVKFLLRGKSEGKAPVALVTSSVKGEGKTLVAVELARAYSSLNKNVLMIGADLRNPQLHSHFGGNKNTTGLSDFLANPAMDWKDCVVQPDKTNPHLKVCFSGRIPPNAPQLLAGSRFQKLLEEARKHFDLVLVDTAPTVLVTDTLMIAEQADVTLYVTRAEYSEKQLLEHAENLHKSGKLENMALVINDVKRGQAKGYNYGYGYGYSAEKKKKAWWAFGR